MTIQKRAKRRARKIDTRAKKQAAAGKRPKAGPYRPTSARDPFGPDAAKIKAAIKRAETSGESRA